MDKDKQKIWLIVLWLIVLAVVFRAEPRAGYGLAAITLLVLLFKLRGANK